MAPKIRIQYSLVEISDKAEAPALLSSIVLGDVDIANPPVLVKQTLEIISGGPEKIWKMWGGEISLVTCVTGHQP